MKNFFTIILMLCVLTTVAQRKNKNKYEDWSGDYVGSFSDINGASGELQITLSESSPGWSGVVLMNFDGDSIVTGSLFSSRYNVDGTNISFNPSNRKPNRLYAPQVDSASLQTSSYECDWNVVVSKWDYASGTIKGKAAPNNCLFYNLLSFEVTRQEK